MSKIIWNSKALSDIKRAGYHIGVYNNCPMSGECTIKLGTEGNGTAPNYQIEDNKGNITTFFGLSHESNVDCPVYDPENLSDKSFTPDDFIKIVDVRAKGPKMAKYLLKAYLCEYQSQLSIQDLSEEDEKKIIKLSMSGIAIAEALHRVLS